MRTFGSIGPSGSLALRVRRQWPSDPGVLTVLRHGLPWFGQEREVWTWRLRNLPHLWRGARRVLLAKLFGCPTVYGCLWLTLIKADGRRVQLGLASMRVVTTAGAGYLVDALQNGVEAENLKFHGFGTGSTAEAVGDTALVTELTTQYAVDSTRPTGTQAENGANVYRTVATVSPDSGFSIVLREHGIFSAASAGVLLDRSVYGAVTLENAGDGLEATYDFTINTGG